MAITRHEVEKFQRQAAVESAIAQALAALPITGSLRRESFTGDEHSNGLYVNDDNGDPQFIEYFKAGDEVGIYPVGS